jgi:hypothetical protein
MAECKDCVAGVLGACRDYCAFERELLEGQAQALAEAHGHAPGPWSKVKGLAHWQAQCNRCGQPLTISLTPGPGELELSGPGLTSPCIPPTS